ncbi:hypothetical protein KI809_01795 [Geobacter pelophilus]|uniref:Membrane protein involved in the export of O-antigen and teichoic acid n=1 Tax=Geoanaerobacter pelophilus TaxID=60036 RepID=A0AAW4KWE7_9BACT|nr:lipid II flippase MurJ [Geoanaerobacter pelophilus]MBT0663019.1 hypothetical protein [Geoanaerobacter pelophilus]
MKLGFFLKSAVTLNTIWATIFSGIGKSSAAIIPFFIAAWFIDQKQTDVFFYVNTLVMFFYGLFSITIEAISVPFFSKEKTHNNISVLFWRLTLSLTVVIFAVCTLIYLFFDPLFGYFSNFTAIQLDIAAELFIVLIPFIVFSVFNSILVSIFYVNNEFRLSSLSSGLRFFVALLSGYLLKSNFGIHSIAIGYSVGELLRAIIMLFNAHCMGFIRFTWPNFILTASEKQYFKHFLLNATGMIFIGLNPIITKSLASQFGPGGVSAIEYSERLGLLPSTLFGLGASNVLFVYWANTYNSDSLSNFKSKFYKSNFYICVAMIIIISIGVLFIDFYLPLILPPRLLGGTYDIKLLIILFMIINLPYILQANLARVQFIRQNQRYYVSVQIVSTLLYALMSFQLVKFLALKGLVLSWFITTLFLLLAYFYGFLILGKSNS